MILKLPLLIWLGAQLILVDTARKKSIQVRFLNITTKFNPELSKWVDFSITPESNGRLFDLSWNLSVDISKALHISVDIMTKNTETNTFNSFYPYEFDYCRVWDGFMSQAIARVWFSSIKKYGNFPGKCPIPKGYYYLKKLKLSKGSLPPFVPLGFYFTKVMMYIQRDTNKDMIFDSFMETEIWMG